ncbi:unnamed protein product [Phaeothamnion confervicola]
MLANGGCPTHARSDDGVGMYPIHWACTEGSLWAVRCVQATSTRYSRSDLRELGKSPYLSSIGTARWLLARGADGNCRDKQGCTPLVLAAQYGFVDIVIYLFKRGVDPSIHDINDDSALHWAAYKGA